MIQPMNKHMNKHMFRHFVGAAALAGMLGAASVSARAQPGISVATCEADFQALLAAIRINRESSIAEIERQIGETTPDRHPALNELKEAAWMQEEHERRQADQFHRDCLKAAKP